MGDKYVAYLDILGFKNWLTDNDIYEANTYMSSYSAAFHEVWDTEDSDGIYCFMVSDCAVIYSNDINKEKLRKIINMTINISQNLFSKTRILIRGAICKGDFEIIYQGNNCNSIQENIFTGNAYIEAFLLEAKPKVAGIALSKDVSKDVKNHIGNLEVNTLKDFTLIKYFTREYLQGTVFEKFIDLAAESKWIAHYHNTIYVALYKKSGEKNIFTEIIDRLEQKDKSGELTRVFITTAFSEEVDDNYKKQLVTYLRKKLLDV